jgi:hypothetical protein
MDPKILLCIGSGVFVAHLAVFMIYFRITTDFPNPPPKPKPNFQFAEEIVKDQKAGGHIVNREFTVSTKLAPPGIYSGRPDRPITD